MVGTSRAIENFHIGLYGPMRIKTLKVNQYVVVIVDEYSRFSWVCTIKEKPDALKELSKICNHLWSLKNLPVVWVRRDHVTVHAIRYYN